MATKYRTTNREQRRNNFIVISIGYCDIQNITHFLRPEAYTCGLYGWNADFYAVPGFDNVIISTGYRPLHYAMNKRAAAIGERVRRDLLRYDKRLSKLRPFAVSWHRRQAQVLRTLERITARAFHAVPYSDAD